MMCRRIALAVLLCLLPLAGRGAVHRVFPYDSLSPREDERRIYPLAVFDARLAPLAGDARLDWRSSCIEQHALNGIREVLEQQVIPSPETASIPVPYLVERALVTACGGPGANTR